MGRASNFVRPFLGQLASLSQQIGDLTSAFNEDTLFLVYLAEDLSSYFQGLGQEAFVGAVKNYSHIVGQRTSSLTGAQRALNQFHGSVESASSVGDVEDYDQSGQVLDEIFTLIDLNSIFEMGRDEVSPAITQAYGDWLTRQEKHGPIPTPPPPSIYDNLLEWADALRDACRMWQASIADQAFAVGPVPTLNGVIADAAVETSVLDDFNADDTYNEINSSMPDGFKNLITPQEYQQVISTFKDPRTQELLFLLMSTPTGKQFSTYLLYMGKKLGGDSFISWQHLDPGIGGESTNGYILLNIDDYDPNGPSEMARVLVHEAVETYYDVGPGIRQMGQQHADYLAQWWAGKFLYELPPNLNSGSDPCSTSYGKSFSAWTKTADGQGYAHEGVTIDTGSRDSPGVAWSSNDPSWWAWLTGQQKNVGKPPNPMGLTPQMLTVDDMNKLDPVPSGFSCS